MLFIIWNIIVKAILIYFLFSSISVPIALSGIENSYLILAENLAQSYLDTSNDIGQKLAEIKVATSLYIFIFV